MLKSFIAIKTQRILDFSVMSKLKYSSSLYSMTNAGILTFFFWSNLEEKLNFNTAVS